MGCLALILVLFFGGGLGFLGFSQPIDAVAPPASVEEVVVVPTVAALPDADMPASYVSAYEGVPQSRTEDGAFVLGAEDAPITIVAFEDFLCPHCQAYQTTLTPFIDDYVRTGMAKFEFRMLPTQSVSGQPMALAECADEIQPGSFWDAHDAFFELAAAERYTPDRNSEFADAIFIAYEDLLPCAVNAKQYETDTLMAREVGVNSTPTVMLRYSDGELVAFPDTTQPDYDALAAVVEAAQ